ncbi:MAG: right-handed parallel beta-helix repeat-containing protein [Candidatus Omnitrophica bacterium]|nr:right-handed parallel beta-helix repeat-containing protein [Candidatus Omnitrophota bacterium]
MAGYKKLIVCLIIYGLLTFDFRLLTFDYGLVYAQNADLKVSADARGETLILDPQAAAPASPVEGQVYYDDNDDKPYYYDGTSWETFSGTGGDDKTVATKIVAASNSLDTTRADYVCDGTDDQVEIQQAIDALGASGGGVYLLEGIYNISAPINFDNVAPDDSNKSIIGAGAGTVVKLISGANGVSVINASNVNRIFISQLMIDGNAAANPNVFRGIRFGSVTSSKIDKIWMKNIRNDGNNDNSNGIRFQNSSNNILSNSTLVQASGCGLYIVSPSNNNIITGNEIASSPYGIFVIVDPLVGTNSTNNIVSENVIRSNSISGICFYSGGESFIISNNQILQNAGGWGVLVKGKYHTISGNNIQANGYGITFDQAAEWNIIRGNFISLNTQYGIYLYGRNNDITGNILYENGNDGISFGNSGIGDNNNLISFNRLYDSAGASFGINLSGPNCQNNYLVSNFIDGAGYIGAGYDRRIQDLGTNTKYTDKTKLTFEPGSGYTGLANGNTLTPDGPTSYLRLSPAGNVNLGSPNIAAGKAAGDLLILENTTVNRIRLSVDASTKLHSNPLDLYQNDILTLIWNGAAWVEIGYGDN